MSNESTPSPVSEAPIIFKADRWAIPFIVVGILLILVVLILPSSSGGPLAAPAVIVTIGIWNMSAAYVKLNDDHFETKLAPAIGWHSVLYSEVVEVEQTPKMLKVYIRKHNAPENAKLQQIAIRLGQLSNNAQKQLIEEFQKKLPKITFKLT